MDYEHRASVKLDRMAVINAVADCVPKVNMPGRTLYALIQPTSLASNRHAEQICFSVPEMFGDASKLLRKPLGHSAWAGAFMGAKNVWRPIWVMTAACLHSRGTSIF